MVVKNKFKLIALARIAFSVASLLVHLLLAIFSAEETIHYMPTTDGIYQIGQFRYRKLWDFVQTLEALQPCANPRNAYPVIFTYSGDLQFQGSTMVFCMQRFMVDLIMLDLRMLNATLVIPEIQESLCSKGISSKFNSFSYVYNEEHFIAALSNDVLIVKSLPVDLKEERKKKYPTFSVRYSASPSFYINDVLPKLNFHVLLAC